MKTPIRTQTAVEKVEDESPTQEPQNSIGMQSVHIMHTLHSHVTVHIMHAPQTCTQPRTLMYAATPVTYQLSSYLALIESSLHQCQLSHINELSETVRQQTGNSTGTLLVY